MRTHTTKLNGICITRRTSWSYRAKASLLQQSRLNESRGHPWLLRRSETAALCEWLNENWALNTPSTHLLYPGQEKTKVQWSSLCGPHGALTYCSALCVTHGNKESLPFFKPKIHMVSKASIRVRPRPNHSLKVLDTGFSSSWPQANFR